MPTLRLSISGLCFFAFNRPLLKAKGNPVPTAVTLLLQRLTRSRELSRVVNFENEILDQHFPLLEFDPDDRDVASSTRGPDFLCAPDATGKMKKGVCLLFGDDLSFLIDGRPMRPDALSLTASPPVNPNASQLTGADKETLWWMATLEDAFPGHGAINPIFKTDSPGPNQPILARIQLTEGQLRTVDLSDSTCTFVPPGSATFNQRIATSFSLEVPFQNTVEIAATRPANGNLTRSRLVFSPSSGKDLQIEIKNMEIDSLIGLEKAYGPRPEADFETYADLLLSPPAAGRSFLVQRSPGNPSGVGLSHCPPSGG
ncbi:MAG TPA: hypothetical protein VGQ28_18365 [Thermoanaerobaculia bacterium]|jgi:hypothetical protein|nr:hypothetical protein [Thermoanaerobaculia bacterium]